MTEESLRAALSRELPLQAFDCVDSTNRVAKEWAHVGGAVVANRQTGGRGRLGRAFYSPEGGVYLSVILPPRDPLTLTSRAAVAVCRAIETLCGLFPRIKWVNDLLIDGKKVCGILAEGVISDGALTAVVLGVGVNLYGSDFPPELASIAGALYARKPDVSRSALAAAIIEGLLCMPETFAEEYRARSCVLSKPVRYQRSGVWREGVAEDIDEQGALLVRTEAGIDRLNTGEITLRL